MIWGLTSTDFKNAGWNSLHMAAPYWGSIAVAAATNIATHKIFKLEKESWGSFAAKGISLAAGAALSLALASRSTLIEISRSTSWKLTAICLPTLLGCAWLIPSRLTMIAIGPVYFGTGGMEGFSLYLPGACGSVLGVDWSDEYLFPPRK